MKISENHMGNCLEDPLKVTKSSVKIGPFPKENLENEQVSHEEPP